VTSRPPSDDIPLLGDAGRPLDALPVVASAESPEGASSGGIAAAVADAAAGIVAGDEGGAGDAAAPGSRARLLVLLAGNVLPLLGVLLFDWQVFPIILLFWAENVVFGVFTVLKMRRAQGTGGASRFWANVSLNGVRPVDIQDDRRRLIRLFRSNYFGFTVVHGIFVVVLFGGVFVPQKDRSSYPVVSAAWFLVALAGLVLSYLREYRRDFLAGGGYKLVSPIQVMAAPYGRMIVMHLTIIFAGWFVASIGAPLAGLILLVLLKTAFDVVGWLHERRSAGRAPAL
jgi:hypothetical protein